MRNAPRGPVAPRGFWGSAKHGLPLKRATLNNLVVSAVVGLLVGLSPFSTARLGVSVVLGGLAGVTLFAFRERRRRRAVVEGAVVEEPLGIALPPVSLLVVLFLLGILFAPTLVWLYQKSTASIWTNGHGLFTPFIMAYLAHRALSRDADPVPDSCLWGLPIVALGVLLLIVDLVPQTRYIASLGLILCLPGLSLLLLGARRTRMLALPLVLGVFLIPIPDVAGAHLLLQDLTTTGTVPLLRALGHPVARYENVIVLPVFTVNVSRACSGFSALYAAIFLTVILVAHSESWPRRILLVLAVLPVALASNIVRVFALVMLVQYTGVGSLETLLHPASGALTFWFVMAVLILIAGRPTLRRLFA